MADVRVYRDGREAALAVASEIAAAAREAIAARGELRLGLSGGRTPEDLYRLLSGPDLRARIAWGKVRILFADERDVPPTEPESNYWLVRKTLVEPVGIAPEHVHRMKADADDLEAAARDYELRLETPLDLLILGVGEDGHVASLFPGSALLTERTRRVAAVTDSPKPPRRRMTLTPRALAEARAVRVMASGGHKAVAVARALAETGEVAACPARLVRDASWRLDTAAAGRLAR